MLLITMSSNLSGGETYPGPREANLFSGGIIGGKDLVLGDKIGVFIPSCLGFVIVGLFMPRAILEPSHAESAGFKLSRTYLCQKIIHFSLELRIHCLLRGC